VTALAPAFDAVGFHGATVADAVALYDAVASRLPQSPEASPLVVHFVTSGNATACVDSRSIRDGSPFSNFPRLVRLPMLMGGCRPH
jgi:hypothetical protein